MTLTIGTIEAEASACRAAWAACPGATHGAHIHHEEACEQLTEPIENRIAYILRDKPTHEIALRLRLMRPTTAEAYAKWRADLAPIYAKYNADLAPIYAKWRADLAPIHHLVCSIDGCPFDGRTIFPEVGS